ncbi:unnamed protein product [Zymoseptoria tritici ST99CH_1A5]|uniref:Uncharacterized protein n=1 Tax=Zymoseptoria tritici ST99CH_1A5 TaxID=1276529 RepID=A0A1Y6LA61_ZYMTR|nr:unnamed protein product [Zymoseptoria tritici ST99CH_1A5]
MAATGLSAGLAWVLPVRPDKLGPHLKNFEEAVPTLHALRLCHRYGRGADVHITKLPAELELLIEGFIIHPFKCSTEWGRIARWEDDFKCFESRCSPLFHLAGASSLDCIYDDFTFCGSVACEPYGGSNEDCRTLCKNSETDPCEVCKTRSSEGVCEKGCHGRELEESESFLSECAVWIDLHFESRHEWDERVCKTEVDKMNATLRKHFGLEVTFTETRTYVPERDNWPMHKNYKWHDENHIQTTICHLTMPRPKPPAHEWLSSDMEDSTGSFCIEGTQTLAVNMESHISNAAIKQRFQKATNYLRLEPSPHTSQHYSELRPTLEPHATSSDTATDPNEKNEKAIQDEPKLEWPKLVLMLSTWSSGHCH